MESRRLLKIEKIRGESRPVVWVWTSDLEKFRDILKKHQMTPEERSPSKYQVCFRFDQSESEVLRAVSEFNTQPGLQKDKGDSRN